MARTSFNTDLTVRDGIVYAGSKDHRMYAIKASSGEEKWSYNARSDITSGGTLSEDGTILYFGTEYSGFFALDTDSGSRRWCYRCDRDDRSESFQANPTVYQDMVIAPAEGRVYAFNADTTSEEEGKLLWAQPDVRRTEKDWRFREPGTVYKDVFYIGNGQGNSDGTLYGFRTDTGTPKSRLQGYKMPYCQDEECHAGTKPNQYDFEPLRTAVVRNGKNIYFGNDAGELIQRSENVIKWVYRTDKKSNVLGKIAATEEMVIFADRSGAIYAVDPDPKEATKDDDDRYREPKRIWIEFTEDNRFIIGGPVISGDYVYVIDSHGVLYMIDLERGKTRYTLDLWGGDDPCPSFCNSTPAIEGDMLFAGTRDGTIVGIQLPIYAQ